MSGDKVLVAEHAAVASEQPLASLAGYDVLRAGGNAFDAAVATSFALAVTFHPAGGLGGDFFGMFYEAKTGKVHCLNSSGWAPSGLTLELLKAKSGGRIPSFGPYSVVIPGYVAGVWEMHKKFGTREFAGLLSASESYAALGFPAGEGICRSIASALPDLPADARKVFAPLGRVPIPGERIKQERLGRVVSEVAKEGPKAFYWGPAAEAIAGTLRSVGVPAQPSDFREFKPEWVSPLSLQFRGTTVYEVPPNSMGATTLLILKLLSDETLSKFGPLSRERVQKTLTAVLAAYARRDEMLGDPRFGEFDFQSFVNGTDDIGRRRGPVRSGDTTAFSVADRDGNLVSGIQSLFHHFGSRVFVPEVGIFLNNRASGFRRTGPNRLEPRKRPLHTLSSMILEFRDERRLAIGSSGGEWRPQQHALFATNAVDYSLPLETNVGNPRFLWDGGNSLLVEEGYELPRKGGFRVQRLPMHGRTGVCQAVEVSSRYRKAVCDVRGDGLPAGF